MTISSTAIARPRLDSLIDEIGGGGVGLIVAPAGSGKSVLLGQWVARAAVDTCQVRLSALDDDPVRFARSLMSALESTFPEIDTGIVGAVIGAGPSLGEVFLTDVLAEVRELKCDVVLVLDDVHVLTNSAICLDLGWLIDRLPQNMRLLMAARWDPSIDVHRVRLDGRLVEVRAADLAFTVDESRPLLESVAQRSLTEDQTAALVSRTEGWAVGLQLAAILLQRAGSVDGLIERFAGNHQLVVDYLAREVFDDLEPDIRRFLLCTSVLDWLDVDLCDAVTQESNAGQMLDLLARRSLFLVAPDAVGERLRYHHLFADLLRYRLQTESELESDLRRRAAHWLLDRGYLAEAIEHLLAIGDGNSVLQAITERGRSYLERQETATLARWLSAARDLDPNPSGALEVSLLGAQVSAHELAAAGHTYRSLRQRSDLSATETAVAAAVYSCLGMDDLPTAEVRRAAAEARCLLAAHGSEDNISVLGLDGRDVAVALSEVMTGVALLHDSEVSESARQFESAIDTPGAQYPIWRVYAIGGLALTRALEGRCSEARALGRQAISLADESGVGAHQALSFAHFALVQVALDRLDVDAAIDHLQEAEVRIRATGRAVHVSLYRLLRVDQIDLLHGPEVALAELSSSPTGAFNSALVSGLRHAREISLLVDLGKTGQARGLLNSRRTTPPPLAQLVDLELACGDIGAARAAFERWEPAGDLRSSIERLVRLGAILDAEGATTKASAALQEALELAEPDELRHVFVRQSAARRHLRDVAGRGSQAFARSILDGADALRRRSTVQTHLAEPLTDRELQVLDYLPTRMSNLEMASSMFVSVNTLKTHLRHIYAKLNAIDRDDAVAKAAELGML